ncbi:hypothetical protein V1511DRAFT_495202 [Dipodascopsis uninucleata]
MSDSRYSYDENAEVWPYFAATLLSLVLFPSTVKVTLKALSTKDVPSLRKKSLFVPENNEFIQKFRSRHGRSKILNRFNIFLALGWAALLFTIYFIYSQESTEDVKRFDPYEILGISYSASEREIKSRYRKLSVKFHPDKIHNVENTTREFLEAQFVEMTKAYKSLTDEDTRKNFLEYGHPDGPQPVKQGIALPKFLVEERGTPLVILGYGCLVGVALPFFVYNWWNGTKKYTKNGIHSRTASIIFETLSKEDFDNITYDSLVDLLASSEEYKYMFPGTSPAEISVYLKAYLERKPVTDELLKLSLVSKSLIILEGMLDIASAFKNSLLLKKIIKLQQAFIQAVPPESNECLQLPYVKAENIKNADENLNSLLSKPQNEIKDILGLENEEQTKSAIEVAKQIPKLEIVNAFFKVPGETTVSPQSFAHLVIKFRIHYPGSERKSINVDDLLDKDTAITLKKPLATNDDAPLLDMAYAPYLPIFVRQKWIALLTNPRDGKLLEPANSITRMYTDGTISTFKIQLSAPVPDRIGEFKFRLELLSNTYIGSDDATSITLRIEPSDNMDVQDDEISDPEEDSIAGAMAQLRGGKTKKRVEAQDDSEEGEYESSSDEEDEEDSDTDINTDTEDESQD